MPARLRPVRYDHVLLDLDGCVWVGDEPTPGAVEAVAALRAARQGLAFVTNDARHGEEEYVRKLWRLGFQASREEVVTVGGALQHVLAESGHAARRSSSARRRAPPRRRRRRCGSSTTPTSPPAPTSSWSPPRRLRLRRAARRGAGGAARRGARVHRPRRDVPDARRPVARAPGRSSPRSRPATGVDGDAAVGKPEPQLFLTALTASARAARSSSATASTPTWRARAPPASTARSSSPGATSAAEARAPTRRPPRRREPRRARARRDSRRPMPAARPARQPAAGGGRAAARCCPRVEARLRASGCAFTVAATRDLAPRARARAQAAATRRDRR